LKYAFSDKNYFAPLEDPRTILDIGTGTGQWAIEMGDEFPDAEVQGTDLSPIQPSSVPRNVHFFVDDASEPDWVVPPSYFDYIHTRVLLGSFTDFKDIIGRAFHYLKPGGYMESQEIMPTPYCDDGTMPDNWPFKEWMATLDAAAMQADRPLRIASRLKRWYQEAGFLDVQEVVFKMPMNQWPRDRHLKILGRMSEDNWLSGLQALSLAPFSRTLSWSKDEIEVPPNPSHLYQHVYRDLTESHPHRFTSSTSAKPSPTGMCTPITISTSSGAGNPRKENPQAPPALLGHQVPRPRHPKASVALHDLGPSAQLTHPPKRTEPLRQHRSRNKRYHAYVIHKRHSGLHSGTRAEYFMK
jgi:SAM-dependent methyltransferase